MRNLELFRQRVEAYYKQSFNQDGNRRTQRELAEEIGLNKDELSKRLNGYEDRKTKRSWKLTYNDVFGIVRTLVKWRAITTQEQAAELLEIMDYPHLSTVDWNAEPFRHLQTRPIRPALALDTPTNNLNNKRGKEERLTRLRMALADSGNLFQDRLKSFVGRQAELAELRQLIGDLLFTGGSIAITGNAGQGKSNLIAKLVDEYGSQKIAHHFIDFKPSYDYQVFLLRDLMTQLILKHDLSELYVASESRPVLCHSFAKMLAELVEKGRQEVIFIDGLDQLKKERENELDLNFLPKKPMPGIVFVLSMRPDDTLQELKSRGTVREYRLPNLSRLDFEELLKHRGVQLSKRLTDRFYQAAQENALYLDLVAKELVQEQGYAPEEIIARVTDNPDNIFSLSMKRLKRQINLWNTVIYPVFGVILAAREPLAAEHIRQILGVEDYLLREGLTRLGGLLVKDGLGRYAFFHMKLQDYLLQREDRPDKEYLFVKQEEVLWHKKLATWCEQESLSLTWSDAPIDLTEQGRRDYAQRHYIAHLYHASEWTKLFITLDNGVFGHSKIQHDPSMRSYSQDLDLGRQAASRKSSTFQEGIDLLPYLWRYTLLKSSLASIANNYPLAAFGLLVLLHKEREALDIAELLTDPVRKAKAFCYIAKKMKSIEYEEKECLQVLSSTFDFVYSIDDPGWKFDLLLDLLEALAGPRDSAILSEILLEIDSEIQLMDSPDERASALVRLGTALASIGSTERARVALLEAEELIVCLEESDTKARFLGELAGAFAEAYQWERAEAIITSLEENEPKVFALLRLSEALLVNESAERVGLILQEVTELIRQLEEGNTKSWFLSELGAILAQMHRWEAAEKVVLSIKENDRRAIELGESEAALAKISALRRMCQEAARNRQWGRVESLISAIEETDERMRKQDELAETYVLLAESCIEVQDKARAEIMWAEAEAMIRTVYDVEVWLQFVLNKLVETLMQAEEWARAETVIGCLNESRKVSALSRLGKALMSIGEQDKAEENWINVEITIDRIQYDWVKAGTLTEMGLTFAQVDEWERAEAMWAEATVVIGNIEDKPTKAGQLCQLGRTLDRVQQRKRAEGMWADTAAIIRTIEDEYTRAWAWSGLVGSLAEAKRWEYATRVSSTIEVSEAKSSALEGLSKAFARDRQWEHAKMVINTIEEDENRAIALVELGEELNQVEQSVYAEALWEEASMIIYSLLEDDARERALAALGKAFARARQWERAVNLINSVQDHRQKAWALSELAGELAQGLEWDQAEDVINAIAAAPDLKAGAIIELAEALFASHETERLLRLVQGSWLEAETRVEVILLLPAAYGFVSFNPEIGIAFYEAFAWADDFLKKSGTRLTS
jgi:AAA ATPase domain